MNTMMHFMFPRKVVNVDELSYCKCNKKGPVYSGCSFRLTWPMNRRSACTGLFLFVQRTEDAACPS